MLRTNLARCDAVVVVIGRDWIDMRDTHGNRRLDDPTDFVRMEVRVALKRHIPVIPVLVNGATMPAEGELPPPLGSLRDHQAVT